MSTPKQHVIVVAEELNDRTLGYLGRHGRVVQTDPQNVVNVLGDADALVVRTYTTVDEALLARAPRLKVVARAGVALDNIDLAACRARGVQVVHTPEANTLAVVDYTVNMIIRMNRRFWPMDSPVPAEQFLATRKRTFGRFLSGLTLGIVGCGRIGSRVGRAAAGLGMNVIYNDIREIQTDYPAAAVDKPALWAKSDIVTLHVPLTDLTRRLINAETLAAFKPGAQLVNCARGACVNYDDLAAAIRNGRISAAAIDCHDPEPPPPDYPMFGLGEDVILTPHIAARVPKAIENMCDVVLDVVAVLRGRRPKFPAQIEP